MNFLRQIALCYEKIGLSNMTYNHIMNDLVHGRITNYKEAADKYYKGNELSMYKAADRIKNEFYRDTLDFDSYHNDAQRTVMEVRIRSAAVKKLLYMGFRKLGIETAMQTYKAAYKYHIFDIAADMASILSQHYGQFKGDLKQCEKWYSRYKKASRQNLITHETRFMYAVATSTIRHDKSNSQKNLEKLHEVIRQLSAYKNDAESYFYWTYFYLLKISYHELQGEYSKMLKVASEGYSYFIELPIDHKSAKLAMVSYVIHGHNLMQNYSEAMKFESLVKELNQAGTNTDIAHLRLVKAYINLYKTNEAYILLDNIKGSLSDVAEKIDLYKSYCTGEYPIKPTKDDPDGMDIAYKIATLYCDILRGKTDRYTHNYLLKYIRRHDIAETREGLIIKILSLMRHRGYDSKKFERYYDLRLQLSATPAILTEVEILQYEKMLDKIDALYN